MRRHRIPAAIDAALQPSPVAFLFATLDISRAKRLSSALLIGLILALAAGSYLWFVRKHGSPYASNADASGYLNHARLLLSGRLTDSVSPLGLLPAAEWNLGWQQPLGFIARPDGRLVPAYPVGYPLHLVLAAFCVGLDWSAVAVNTFAAAFAALAFLWLARECLLPWRWALAGVAIFLLSPLVVFYLLQPMSDVLATAWLMTAVASAAAARRAPRWAALAGFALGVAVLVRPTAVLLLPALAATLGLRPTLWLRFILAGLPAAGFLAWHNLALHGALLTTGYGDYSWAFSRHNLAPVLRNFGIQLPLHLSLLVFPALLALPWLWAAGRPLAATLLLWLAAFFGFHSFYWFSQHDAWSLRFILPALPPLILAGLIVSRRTCGWLRHPVAKIVWPGLALIFVLTSEVVAHQRLHTVIMKRGEIVYVQAAYWLRDHAPAGSVLLTRQGSGAAYFYTSIPLVRYDLAGSEAIKRLCAAALTAHRPVFVLMDESERRETADRFPASSWSEEARFGTFSIRRLHPVTSVAGSAGVALVEVYAVP